MNEALSRREMDYLGGLFDGEGHFGIAVYQSEGTSLGYRADTQVKIAMLTRDGDDPAREIIGRFFEEVVPDTNIRHRKRENHAEMWVVNTMGKSARRTMEELQPHMKLKSITVEKILDLDWSIVNKNREAFLRAMEIRDIIRRNHNQESKYDRAFFEDEFTPEASSASGVTW